jgi:hypothetical protein
VQLAGIASCEVEPQKTLSIFCCSTFVAKLWLMVRQLFRQLWHVGWDIGCSFCVLQQRRIKLAQDDVATDEHLLLPQDAPSIFPVSIASVNFICQFYVCLD